MSEQFLEAVEDLKTWCFRQQYAVDHPPMAANEFSTQIDAARAKVIELFDAAIIRYGELVREACADFCERNAEPGIDGVSFAKALRMLPLPEPR